MVLGYKPAGDNLHTFYITVKKIQERGCNHVSSPDVQRKYKIKSKHTSQHYPELKQFRV
jgi:hypothetical protein